MTQSLAALPTQTAPTVAHGADIDKLVPGARGYFSSAVEEYATMLLAEARNIEEMEHQGSGPAEITAAHVEEAKWVLRRRQRRRLAHGNWLAVLRIGQALLAILVGAGGSNLKEWWGPPAVAGGGLLAAALVIVEREITRD